MNFSSDSEDLDCYKRELSLMSCRRLGNLDFLKKHAFDFFKSDVRDSEIIILDGDMGVGKTTWVQFFLEAVGSKDFVCSPTYSIYNEYSVDDLRIYHWDFYRLENFEELVSCGFWDKLQEKAIFLIEWGSRLKFSVWPHNRPLSCLSFSKDRSEISWYSNRERSS